MRQPDTNSIKPDIQPGPTGKALEDFQAGGGGYPQGEIFNESGLGELSGAPPARSSDDPYAHTKLGKKGLAPSKAADPPICHCDANAHEPNLSDATSDV